MSPKPSTSSEVIRVGDRVIDLSGEFVFGIVTAREGVFVEADWWHPESDYPVRAWLGEAWVRKM